MLAMDLNLMGSMDTPHLIAALEAEGPLTPAEMILSWRLEAADEESEFCTQLVREILDLCDKGGTREELVADIKSAVENSYVEL